MVYRGHVRNGRIELEEAAELPEGAEVDVLLRKNGRQAARKTTLYEGLKDFIGAIDDLPPDASVNIDHYCYGHPNQ